MLPRDPMNLEYFHPLFVHFPVALTLCGAFLLSYGGLREHPNALRSGLVMLLIAGIFVIPTYITGEVARSVLEDSSAFERDLPLLDAHEDLGLASLGLLVSLGVVAGLALARPGPPGGKPWGLLALALAAALLIGLTAFYGGRLVFEKGVGVKVEAGIPRDSRGASPPKSP